MTYATVIADSISPDGHRLTTIEVEFHRFVLAEFNTHRVFSRNSASSRAIPLKRTIKNLQEQGPAFPVIWACEQPGMSGGDEIEDTPVAKILWRRAMDNAIASAEELANIGVHKSLCNRLLEPFMWHKCIVTSTEWENFFGLRVSRLAQPEMEAAAIAMQRALYTSSPNLVEPGEWHLPYVQPDELGQPLEHLQAVSVARCARVSLLNHDKIKSVEDDLKLFNRLKDPGEGKPHASPLEHVATPIDTFAHRIHPHTPGNFEGWRQLRHEVFK